MAQMTADVMEHEFHPDHPLNSFVNVWRSVVFTPRDFFMTMPRHGGYANPILFLLICSAIGALFAALISQQPATVLAAPIGALIGSFFLAGILHLFAMVFAEGAKGGYQGTWRVLAYVQALTVVTWIPVIGQIIALYGIYLTIVGIEKAHATSTTRAALTVLVPFVIFFAIAIAVAVAIGSAILGALRV